MKAKLVQSLPLCFILILIAVMTQGVTLAEPTETAIGDEVLPGEKVKTQRQNYQLFASRLPDAPRAERVYPLFRAHAHRYYPERDAQKATRLSMLMPGLGQAYAGNYGKASFFLVAELGTFALAGYNLARALHYNDSGGFETGFHDPRLGEFLTADQARVRMRNHTVFSGLFLVTGIGLHLWNVFDAAKTTEAYNNRRFSVQMQQRDSGMHSVVFTHQF